MRRMFQPSLPPRLVPMEPTLEEEEGKETMKLRSRTTIVALVLTFAGLVLSAAQAATRPDDRAGIRGIGQTSAVAKSATVVGIAGPAAAAGSYQGSVPDVRDAAAAARPQTPDVFERYAAAHPYGAGLWAQPTPVERSIAQERARPHDPAIFGPGPASSTNSTLVSRPPDVSDAAEAARYGVASAQSSGFDWGDWGIGIGSGIGLVLVLGIGVAMGLQRRHRVQTA